MEKRVKKIVVFFLVLCILPSLFASVSPSRTIRVGYFAFPGYHEIYEDESGIHGSGYGFDFLTLLRRYTNFNFEYVGYDKAWKDMLDMLRSGEIDMVTSARRTKEREEEFAFSLSIGNSNAELCVLSSDDRYSSNDYRSFDGMRIGVLRGNSRNDDLEFFSREKGFSYIQVEYSEENELSEALRKGEVDAIVTSSLRQHSDEKVVARFALEEFCVMVRKDNTALLDEINDGILEMDANEANWRENLSNKYSSQNSREDFSFTPEEVEYIRAVRNGEKSIVAAAQPDRDPYSYVEDGELKGIIPDYFDYLMGIAGLPYTVDVPSSRAQYQDWTENNVVDVYMDINPDRATLMDKHSGVFSEPYISLTLSRVTKKDFKGEIKTIAVVYNQMYEDYDSEVAENAEKVSFDTRTQALEAVKTGKVDAAYVYTYMAEKCVNQDEDGELIFHLVNMPSSSLAFAIRGETDHELISILNKCLKSDSSMVMDELVEKYTRFPQSPVTLGKFVRNNHWFVTAISALALGVFTTIVLILRNNSRIRTIAEERKALASSLEEKNALLEEAVKEARSANVAKTTFLNNMSHDIRTPMNAIIGFTNIALKQRNDEEVRKCLLKISESSDHLLT
ncbi:MAG: transporter substrate-binding domain-containing protein, partial [Candidatus Ornithospirochaeta sp.]